MPVLGAANLPKLTDPEVRLADMDRLGIDMQVISPSPAHFGYSAPAEPVRDGARMVNDTIAELVARHPSQFAGHGYRASAEPRNGGGRAGQSREEARAAGRRDIHPRQRRRSSTRSGLDGFFARAEELGVVVFIHPAGTSIKERISNHYFTNLVGHPLEFEPGRRPSDLRRLDLLRKSGEFPVSYEELDDTAATVYEGI